MPIRLSASEFTRTLGQDEGAHSRPLWLVLVILANPSGTPTFILGGVVSPCIGLGDMAGNFVRDILIAHYLGRELKKLALELLGLERLHCDL
ncbi:hypothetical protein FRC11_009251, partial [Ceratobasidium sp. 423]